MYGMWGHPGYGYTHYYGHPHYFGHPGAIAYATTGFWRLFPRRRMY